MGAVGVGRDGGFLEKLAKAMQGKAGRECPLESFVPDVFGIPVSGKLFRGS